MKVAKHTMLLFENAFGSNEIYRMSCRLKEKEIPCVLKQKKLKYHRESQECDKNFKKFTF